MKIFVKAKTGAKEEKVEPPSLKLWNKSDNEKEQEWFKISVKERPVQGKANDAIIELLAKHFGITRNQIKLISGSTSKQKVFEIMK